MSSSATARNLVGPLLRWGYRLRVTGAHEMPRRGPLLAVAAYAGLLDPTLIATSLPRPVEVLVDPGALAALADRIPGRIVVDPGRPEMALREAVAKVRAGAAVGAWSGEGREAAAAYLQSRTGCPVVPIALLGSHGRRPTDPPGWRSTIDIVVGPTFTPRAPGDPFSRGALLQVAEVIRQHVVDHGRAARQRTGRLDGVAVDGRWTDPDNVEL